MTLRGLFLFLDDSGYNFGRKKTFFFYNNVCLLDKMKPVQKVCTVVSGIITLFEYSVMKTVLLTLVTIFSLLFIFFFNNR